MSKIRKLAKGQPCMVRIPGVCNFDTSTTVLAHLNGYGIGGKNMDFHGAFCCSSCHDVVDHRVKSLFSTDEVLVYFYQGIFRTQRILFDQGVIQFK
jgi:hypothetical protein